MLELWLIKKKNFKFGLVEFSTLQKVS